MLTAKDTVLQMADNPHWYVPFMDFVDAFRRNAVSMVDPVPQTKFGLLLSAAIEHLCYEKRMQPPEWINDVPPGDPWFVSGIESLMAISLVESPPAFRLRNIFVLANFLDRA
ncbi:MAG: hypothetical protein HW380_3302 [Magnetococcales bacterium]|nr:hypothetical protein [Magnetococcales bacterium]HIJ82634.1 hypothetical protein [Magnetococcales bacterium]